MRYVRVPVTQAGLRLCRSFKSQNVHYYQASCAISVAAADLSSQICPGLLLKTHEPARAIAASCSLGIHSL
jgi:hypothetical protein